MSFADVPAPPVPAYQNVTEFGHLWDLVASRPHASVLEIGSLFGGTLWYWLHLPGVRAVVSVDLPTDWAPVAADVAEARKQWFGWQHIAPRCLMHTVTADSHDPATVDRAATAIAGEAYDFVFIDGDHTYDGVRQDFEMYSPLLRPGGLVAFHDTIPNGSRHEPGVVQFVGELKWRYPSIEFFDPDGVGICAFVVEQPWFVVGQP